MRAHGYTFVIRYVPRVTHHANDIAPEEVGIIRATGLGLMLVQHVEEPGWIPSSAKGGDYGDMATDEARRVGYAPGASLWLDLEGVAHNVPASIVIAYANRWYDRVFAAGYMPGVYVGDRCGLTATELYWRLKFRAYWSAYNLNADQFPVVRGAQLWQQTPTAEDVPTGVGLVIDVDVVSGDALGGVPIMDFSPLIA